LTSNIGSLFYNYDDINIKAAIWFAVVILVILPLLILPLLICPICKEYFPIRLKLLALNELTIARVGIPPTNGTRPVAADTAPIVPHTKLVAKNILAMGLGE
jgi:hypothetical protein